MISSIASNEFLPPETLEEFLGKRDGSFRPSKKIYFQRRPDKADRRELLDHYLAEIKQREQSKLE